MITITIIIIIIIIITTIIIIIIIITITPGTPEQGPGYRRPWVLRAWPSPADSALLFYYVFGRIAYYTRFGVRSDSTFLVCLRPVSLCFFLQGLLSEAPFPKFADMPKGHPGGLSTSPRDAFLRSFLFRFRLARLCRAYGCQGRPPRKRRKAPFGDHNESNSNRIATGMITLTVAVLVIVPRLAPPSLWVSE